jgi:hypothetical protein
MRSDGRPGRLLDIANRPTAAEPVPDLLATDRLRGLGKGLTASSLGRLLK